MQIESNLQSSKLRRLLSRFETYRNAGQIGAAIQSLESALELAPQTASLWVDLAMLQLGQGHHSAARQAADKALAGDLDSPKTALALMGLLSSLSESGLLIEVAKQIPPPVWDSPKSLAEVAQMLTLSGAHDMARQFAQAALQRDPDHPPSLSVQASLDVFSGDLKAAAEHAERCLQRLPNDAGSHWLIGRLKQPGGEARLPRIEAALSVVQDAEDEAHLAYALHDELHQLGRFDAAWQALERGCMAKLRALNFDRQQALDDFQALREWSIPRPAPGMQGSAARPVFVIGLHRSGTTLAERIFSGHSQVAAGGETYDIRAQLRRISGLHFNKEIDRRVIDARDQLDYAAIGSHYLRGMSWRMQGKPVFTDKLPSNYYNLGFIAHALPDARFIHLNRDPRDVGLSSLRTLFSHACPYSYNQLDFANHYHQYRLLMEHWRSLYADRILDIDYQSLVDDPEGSAARMAEFCGLSYEPSMVSIDKRTDTVSTASSVMMREGIRKDRGRLWTKYEQHLQPMLQRLAELGY